MFYGAISVFGVSLRRSGPLISALTLGVPGAAAQSAAVYPLSLSIVAGGPVQQGNEAGLPAGLDGTGMSATFFAPCGIAADNLGNIWIADSGDNTIRKLAPGGVVTTVAGLAGVSGSADGTGSAARFNYPEGIAFDPTSGNLYVADTESRTVRRLTPSGIVTTIAATAGVIGGGDGEGSAAQFNFPAGIVVDSNGNLYVADGSAIRMVTAAGVVTTFAGQSQSSGIADGAGAAAQFTALLGLAIDASGNLYAADANRVRKIAPDGVVSTVAGEVQAGFADGEASAAQFNLLGGVAVDAQNNLFVTDVFSNAIREITPEGMVITVAGGPRNGASQISSGAPTGITVDSAGTVWFTAGNSVWNGIRNTAEPGLIVVPSSQTAPGGSMATFAVEATAAEPLTYQWYCNGVALIDGNGISGSTSATLVIGNAQAANAGTYDLVVSDAAGSVLATLNLNVNGPPPVITAQPAAATVIVGSPVTFSVAVNSGLTPNFQWEFNGVKISGAVSANYTIPASSAANIGLYSVVVTNADGSVTSTAALLAVNPAQPATPIYTLTDLGTLGGANSYAYGINASGTVVGASDTSGGTTDPFVDAGGIMSDLTPGVPGTAYAVNDLGEVVGSTGSEVVQAFSAIGGNLTLLPEPASLTSGGFLGSPPAAIPTGVNNSGAIAITFLLTNAFSESSPFAYLLDSNGLRPIASNSIEAETGGINASGQVAGTGFQVSGSNGASIFFNSFPGYFGPDADGYIMAASGVTSLPLSAAYSIDTAGHVAGADGFQAAYFDGSKVVNLGMLPGDDGSVARGINDPGVIVGDSGYGQTTHAFVWLNGQLMNLSELVTLSDGSAPGLVTLDSARGINASGQIVGWGTFFNGNTRLEHAVLLTPIGGQAIVGVPASQTVTAGQTVILSAAATGSPTSYQWLFNGTPVPGASGPTLTLANIGTTQAGSYSAVVSWGAASKTSSVAIVSVIPAGQLANVSALAFAGAASQAITAGFVVSGSEPKPLLVRGAGPTLAAFNVNGVLELPQLTLFDANSAIIASDAGWGNSPVIGPSPVSAQITAAANADFSRVYAFAFPAGSADSAMMATLPPGLYSAQIAGENSGTGMALAEVYDEDAGNAASRLVNLSSRASVGGSAGQVLTAGFIVTGSGSETILIRAVGPTLAAAPFNVQGAVAQPMLALFDNQQQVIATNSGWDNGPVAGTSSVAAGLQPASASIMSEVGAFALPAGSADCAFVVTLPAGSYTAEVSAGGGTSGIALVEIYDVP